jgi:hypothetical protein
MDGVLFCSTRPTLFTKDSHLSDLLTNKFLIVVMFTVPIC